MVTNPQVDGQAEDDGAGRADVCALEGCDIPLPARALDEHGRLRSGRRPRYCCKGHADAASRQRRARDLAAVADPLAQVRGLGETFLPAARELRTDLAGMIERFEGAQKGALGRVTVAEQEAAEALADAHAARQEADAAEQARRAAVAGAREDRQARDNAVREAERSREDAERARTLAWEQVAEHERARGHAEAARDAAEQSVESLAAEAREMRGLLDAERARVAVLTEGLGAARADLERVRGERAGLSVRLEAAERAVRDQAEAARRDLERAQGEIERATAEVERARAEAAGERRRFETLREEAGTRAEALRAEVAAERAGRAESRAVLAAVQEALAASEARYAGLQTALERLGTR